MYSNDYYSQCVPGTEKTTTTKTSTKTTTKSSTETDKPEKCAGEWATCGGDGYTGPTCCTTGYTCKRFNNWYSQCVPKELA